MSPLEPALDLFVSHVRVEKGLAENSVEAYRPRPAPLRRAPRRARRRRDWERVGRAEVQAHLGELVRRGLSPRSQARALSAIRSLHALLVRGEARLAGPRRRDSTRRARAAGCPAALARRDGRPPRRAGPAHAPRAGATARCSSSSTRRGCASPSSSRSAQRREPRDPRARRTRQGEQGAARAGRRAGGARRCAPTSRPPASGSCAAAARRTCSSRRAAGG